MNLSDLPKDKHYRYFELAYAAALQANGAGRNKFRLGSVIAKKKRLLTVKNNTAKTHPKLLKFTEFPFLHAESNAILSVGMDNCIGTTLYVLRILHNNDLAMAKPCVCCTELIRQVGIKIVFYTTEYGYISKRIN